MSVETLQQKYDKIFDTAFDACNKTIDIAIVVHKRKMAELRKWEWDTTADEDISSINLITEELNDKIEKALQVFDEEAIMKVAGDEYAEMCWNKVKDELIVKITPVIGVKHAKARINNNRLLSEPKRWWRR
jgi:hypothetical protein